MNKKLVGSLVALTLLLLMPVLVSAQTTTSTNDAALIAQLEQLIVILTKELQQLIAAHRRASSSRSTAILPSPTGGSSPSLTNPGYQSSTQLSATIDQSSLITNTSTPTIMGTVPNTFSICVVMLNANAGSLLQTMLYTNNRGYVCDAQPPEGGSATGITISSGHWSMNTAFNRGTIFGNGVYNVGVYDENTGTLLTTGKLTINTPQPSVAQVAAPQPTPSTLDRISVRQGSNGGEFYDTVTGQVFTPHGNNYARIRKYTDVWTGACTSGWNYSVY